MEGIREANFGSRSRRLLAIALATLVLFGAAGQALAQGFAQAIPGKNVDIVGPTPPFTGHAGNVLMQQNEVAGGTSLWKPNVQYAAFNDYRLVYDPDGGDAVIGFGYSTDYGKSWFSYALPGFSKDDPSFPPGGADANIVVLPGREGGGVVLVNHMAFWRDESQAAELRTAILYEHNREVGPPVSFLRNVTNNTGNSSQFHDKPSFEGMLRDPAEGLPDIVLDIPPFEGPPGSGASHDGYPLAIQAARVHTCYTKFVGNADGTKVECQYTDDLINWSAAKKLSESVEINQGTSIALQNFGQTMTVCWTRFEDNNDTGAVMCTKSFDGGETHSKAEVVTEFCAPHWGTGAARFRYNSLPIVTASGDNPEDVAVFFSSRNDAGQTCDTEGKGSQPDTVGMSPVRLEDDFDAFGEPPRNADGSRNKDGFVRTSRNFARIMTVRQRPNGRWGDPQQVDRQDHPPQAHSNGEPLRKNFHQIMPACESAGGTMTCSYFDTRLDRLNNLLNPIAGGFIEDVVLHFADTNSNSTLDAEDSGLVLPAGLYDQVPPPASLPPAENNFPLRRNLDVFAVQFAKNPTSGEYESSNYIVDPDTWYADADGMPSSSVRVSRFATRQDPDGPIGQREQVEFNFGGARMFNKGRAPFMSDYNSVWALSAIQQQQVLPDGTMGTVFVPNHRAPNPATDLFPSIEPVFNLGWTSNHLVRGKVFYTGCDTWDETLQMWVGDCASTNALPQGALLPLVGEDADENPPMMCTMAAPAAGPLTRNQTVMFAPMRPGVHAEVVSAIKGPTFDPSDPTSQPSTFVINISNGTRSDRTVMLSIEPANSMQFDKQTATSDPLLNIDVVVPRGSSNARTVFDYGDPNIVSNPDGLASSVILTVSEGPQVLARLTLDRDSLVPLENVPNNPDLNCTDPNDPSSCEDFVDLLTQEFYELILKREIATTQSLDLENLDFENTTDLLDFENLDFENLDFENQLVFLDFENLDLENLDLENSLYSNRDTAEVVLDLENLDFENRLLFLDLENLDLENQILEFLDFENLDFENLDFENLDFENLDFENLDFENLDFENVSTIASDIENLDFENLDFENFTPDSGVATYTEVSWTADSATNTTTGVDIQPVFSQQLAEALLDPDNNAGVLLTVRKAYMTPTVVTVNSDPENMFCTPQVVAQNQIVYAAVLTPEQIANAIFDGSVSDPPPDQPDTPGFFTTPDASLIISYRFINLPASIDAQANSGLLVPTQAGDATLCDSETPDTEITPFCEFDFPIDETAPEITLDGDNPMTVEAGTPYVEPGAFASDDIDGDVTGDISIVGFVDTDVVASYMVDYNVSDAAGNPATTVTRTINVVDTTIPVITVTGSDQTIEAGGTYTELGATAEDPVIGPISPVLIGGDTVDTSTVGTYVVTYNIDDASGNSADEKTLTVTVVDTTVPVITVTGSDQTIEAGGTYTELGATAEDPEFGPISPVLIGGDVVDTSTVGTYVVRYNIDDASGNSADEKTLTVTVVDTTVPVITVTGSNQTIEAGGTYTELGATAEDPEFGPISPVLIGGDVVDTSTVGNYVVRYNIVDASGNPAAEQTLTVTVVDTTVPVITVTGSNQTIEAGGTYSELGATAEDPVFGPISPVLISGDVVDTSTVGTYVVRYNIVDASGNPAAEQTLTVTVVDTTAPVITVTGSNQTIEAGVTYTELGATAEDPVFGPISPVLIGGDTVDTLTVGTYVVRYNIVDASGNPAAEQTLTVTVVDTTAPVIIAPANVSAEASATLTPVDIGMATATDAVGVTSIFNNAPVSSTYPVGTTTVTWTATDGQGNSATAAQTVTITDVSDPVIIIDPDDFIPGAPYVLPAGSPSDATIPVTWPIGAQDPTDLTFTCSIAGSGTPLIPLEPEPIFDPVTGTLTQNFSYNFPVGFTSVSCSVTDEGGNVTTGTFDVLVEDVPTISIELDPDCDCVPVITDADGGITATVFEADLIDLLTVNDFITDPADLTVSCLGMASAEFAVDTATDITCTVTDTADPANSAFVQFPLVVAYRYDVVFDLPKGRLRAGSTLPVDFSYVEGNTQIDSSTFAPMASWTGPYDTPNCPAQDGTSPDDGNGEDSGESGYRWSPSNSTWQYSWQTPPLTGSYDFTISPPGTAASTTTVCLK